MIELSAIVVPAAVALIRWTQQRDALQRVVWPKKKNRKITHIINLHPVGVVRMGLEVGRGTAPVRALGAHVRGVRAPLCLVSRAQRPVSQGPLSRQRLPPDKQKNTPVST